MSKIIRLFCLLLVLPTLGACSQLLDIENAHVDSSLLGGGGGTSEGSAGSAGSATSMGGTSSNAGDGAMNQGGALAGGAGGSAGTSGSPNIGGASPAATPCQSYCDIVMANCKDKYEQYRTVEQCIEVCKRLPPGNTGDENVNSVACRVRQATYADSEPFVYCKSAGPLGAGKCGSNCVSYCSLMQAECTAQSTAGNLELSYFDSEQSCLDACDQIPVHTTDPTQYSSSATAMPSSFVGNNVYCRAYHVAAGIEQDTPTEHCPHAMGGDPCIDQ